MAKPGSLPRWANSGGAIVEPNSGKKDVGFVAKERPPAQYLNWLLNLIYQWILWLDGRTNDVEHLTIPAGHGIAITGDWSFTGVATSAGGSSMAVFFAIPVGSLIESIDVRVNPADTDGDITATLVNVVDGGQTPLAAESSASDDWQTITLDNESSTPLDPAPHVVIEGVYGVVITGAESGDIVESVTIRYTPAKRS